MQAVLVQSHFAPTAQRAALFDSDEMHIGLG
jgi:hypothetical protein